MTDPNATPDTTDDDINDPDVMTIDDESQVPQISDEDLPVADRMDVPAPTLDDEAQIESDNQDKTLKAALLRRGASQNTDDENLLGLAPGDSED